MIVLRVVVAPLCWLGKAVLYLVVGMLVLDLLGGNDC